MSAIWAGFDVGTNSVKLLVGAVEGRAEAPRLEVLHHEVRVTRMGEGLNASGVLSEAPMQRALDAIDALAAVARQYAPRGMSALGMEAFRRAANSQAFARRIEERTGISLRVLEGEEEARLGREGVLLGFGEPLPEAVLVVDIGGGSTELALTRPSWEVSVPRGAVTTSEAFLRSDPPTRDEMEQMRTALEEVFQDAWASCPAASAAPTVVAVGGTITTYAAIAMQLAAFDATRVHRARLTASEIRAMTDRLAALPLSSRRDVVGLDPGRAPYIVGGGGLLEAVLRSVGAHDVRVSVANLLHAHVVHEALRC